ncbi:ABC transporter [Arcanobacterium canis]|uniref:ABC transporter n=1 Tax=Arcanobacterium canis TaxID=999183 RepID=A0ABY8FWZ3_9ACTO|nr:ABC transporter [Arcanobacterium canis]WFM83013.1 ABC transporter [Arcanobacterium canis]
MIAIDLKSYLRSPENIFYAVVLPIGLYIVFGAVQSYGKFPLGHGNVNAMVLINMALYGAATGVVGYAGTVAMERVNGWGRQLAITPLRDTHMLRNRVVVALVMAALPLFALFFVGQAMGAQAPLARLAASFVLIAVLVTSFALYGLGVALLLRSETAASIAAGLLVVFGFLGNIFSPLGGTMLTISKFTPLYGIGVLARNPVTGGNASTMNGTFYHESLSLAMANYVAWTVLFAVLALWGLHRSRNR